MNTAMTTTSDRRRTLRLPSRRGLLRVAGWTLGALIGLALLGASWQQISDRRYAAAHPAPGTLVPVAPDRDLHLLVMGAEHEGATIVLDAGMGTPSTSWAGVQPEIAQFARVVAYDRAGIGWSDESPGRNDPTANVDDLRTALHTLGLEPPYILVGHSLGGFHARLFAARYPDETAGLVLVDPSHEGLFDALPAMREQIEGAGTMMQALRVASRLAVLHLYHPFAGMEDGLPEPSANQLRAYLATSRGVDGSFREFQEFLTLAERVEREAGTVGDVPLVLLSAADAEPGQDVETVETFQELHRELAASASQSDHRLVPGANHITLVSNREHATAIVEAVREVVDSHWPRATAE